MSMCEAMDENERLMKGFKKTLANLIPRMVGDDKDDDDEVQVSMHGRLRVQSSRMISAFLSTATDDDDEEEKERAKTQYRLTTVKVGKQRGETCLCCRLKCWHSIHSSDLILLHLTSINLHTTAETNIDPNQSTNKQRRRGGPMIPGMYEDTSNLNDSGCCRCCFCPRIFEGRVATKFLHWSFRSTFVVVFGCAAIGWLALTFLFAFFIYILGELQPYCIGSVYSHKDSPNPFSDAYELSWTTFSTVVRPILSGSGDPLVCWRIWWPDESNSVFLFIGLRNYIPSRVIQSQSGA